MRLHGFVRIQSGNILVASLSTSCFGQFVTVVGQLHVDDDRNDTSKKKKAGYGGAETKTTRVYRLRKQITK